jgi:O-antigen/teichoic acid export membrane protein
MFSAFERYANLLLFVGATAVLSRLLTPAEFGAYAVVSALTTVLSAAFQEFGGANYLIQKRELSHDDIRSALTVTLLISIAVGAGIYLLAGPIAGFFKQESMRLGMVATAPNFLLAPFSGTLLALYRKRLDFRTPMFCGLVSAVVTSVASIVLAILKFSYMAPIWGALVGNVALLISLLAMQRDMSIFRPSLAAYRSVVGFGLYSSGISLINVFYGLAPQLFLARILDFASVGLYSRAVNTTQMFDKLVMQVLNPVIMPAFAARRTAGEDLKEVYFSSAQLLAAVQWPAMVFIALMAQPIISIWLGANWLEIVPLVRILCIGNIFLFAACLSYPTLVAAGSVRDALRSSLISLPPSLLIILGASFFGVEAVAASTLLTLPFQAAVAFYFIGRQLRLSIADFGRALVI